MKHETSETEIEIPTPQQYLDELDRLVDLPQNEQNSNAYIDTLLWFYLDHPNAATPVLRMILPKIRSVSNASIQALGQMSARAFPEATFPYIPFAKKGRVSAEVVRSWFTNVVAPSAFLARMKKQFGRLVYMGLWSLMHKQDDLCRGIRSDLAEEVEACSRLVWTWAAQPEITLSLMREKPTRVGTRLRAYASSTVARTWKTFALRAKKKEPVIVAVDDPEQKPIKSFRPIVVGGVIVGGTPVEQQKPRTTAMSCASCKSLVAVLSEAEGSLHLACGHSRGVNSSGITPAK